MLRDKLSGVPSEVLGLRARLSQAWLAPGVFCVIVFIVKLQLLRYFLSSTFKLVNEIVVRECETLTVMAERATQAPEEIVRIANQLIAASVNGAVRGILDSMQLMLKATEALILFTLDIAVGSYACLTISAVNIAANEAINATEAIIGVANKTAESIGKDINRGLGKLSDFINGAEGLIDSVEEFMTGSSADLHSVNLTVSRLDHLNISSDINTKLESLRKDVPTYDGTKAAVSKVISEPFKYLESRINSSNITFRPTLAAPLSTSDFQGCDVPKLEADLAKLERYVIKIINVLCALCVLVAVGLLIAELWKTKSRWRRLETLASSTNPFSASDEQRVVDNMQLITAAETPFIERFLFSRVSQPVRWFLRYILHAPLLALLLLGLAGIAISLLELIVYSLVKSGLRDFVQLAESNTDRLTGQIKQALSTWRNETNANIASTESQVNQEILGWVHQGSQSVNNSISTFMSSVNGEIETIFNGTGFLRPLQAVVYCLIGTKVAKVEEGLTWIHGHSQVSLPRVPQQLISQNMTATAVKAKSEAEAVFRSSLAAIHHQIVVQSIVSSVLVAVWLVFVICAFSHAFWLAKVSREPPSNAGEPREKPREKRPALSPTLKRPTAPPPELYIPPSQVHSAVRSPIDRLSDRVSHFFAGSRPGPARQARVSGLPQHASYISAFVADSPRTPLRSAMFDH